MNNNNFEIRDGILFSYKGHEEYVTVPEGVTCIAFGAFPNNGEVEEVVLPKSPVCVFCDHGANFAPVLTNCDEMTLIDRMPGDNEGLKYSNYNGARYLGNKNNPYYVLVEVIDKETVELEIHEDTVIIAACAFSGCGQIQRISIPKKVTYIGRKAFANCIALEDIKIPDGVRSIDMRAFSKCLGLQSVVIPNSVTTIQRAAFAGCDNLHIKVPRKVYNLLKDKKDLYGDAFEGCKEMEIID